MNFSNKFIDVWNSKFDGAHTPPRLDCLKADQFRSLLEQKQALEFEESKRCAVIEELKQQLDQESFITEFLHKCIQKLGAVSHVFNEIDQSDSKSSSSSTTAGQHQSQCSSPPLAVSTSSSLQSNKFLASAASSSFPLFPHCIASSLIHSASPLLAAAAAAAPSSPFLLPSSLSACSAFESIKPDPDPEPLNSRPSSFLLPPADRSSYDALTRLAVPTSLYNNPFSNRLTFSPNLTSHTPTLRSQPSSLDACAKANCTLDRRCDPPNIQATASEAQAQAAAAVAAAFGFGFPPVISGSNPTNQLSNFNKPDTQAGGNNLVSGIHSVYLPTNGTDGKELSMEASTERPYQCVTCSRSFAVKAGLVQHMRTHTDERPYPCVHCGRAFKQKIQLTTHMRVHSGERPYGCRLCGKLFRQQSHVVQHLRTHTGEKPHKCYQCGKAFRQKYSLISHQRRMCRNRAASNPIAAGMTMWISPGAGGDTCNLVKEFSPAKSVSLTKSVTSPNTSVPTPISVTTPVSSPYSPYLGSPSVPVNSTSMGLAAFPSISTTSSATTNFHLPNEHHHDARHLSFSSNGATTALSRSTSYRYGPSTLRESSNSTQSHTATQLDSEEEEDEEEEDEEEGDGEEEEEEEGGCSHRPQLGTTHQSTALGLS